MSLIFGAEGYNKLQSGYETMVNDSLRRAYTVSKASAGGVLPGDLLLTSSATQVYGRATAALSTTQKIAGIALATNVLLDPMFPESVGGNVSFQPGVHGAALIRGSMAVPFTGTAPTEGANAFYDFTARAFTASAGTGDVNIPLTGARFTGKVQGNVAEIFVQYI